MNPWDKSHSQMSSNSATRAVERDEGLRSYMLRVYNYMASALILTGVVAYLASGSEAIMGALYSVSPEGYMQMSPLGWIVALAPIGFVFFLGFRIQKMSFQAAQMTFWAFAAIMGLSLSYIFLTFTGASITRVFFITAGTFGGMSLYGYTTKRDLTSMGSFLMMGLIGLIIASVVNIFLGSTLLHFAVSILGVGVFLGLTAYDTQKLKTMYYHLAGNGEALAKSSLMGALSLYLDFINLFIMLLRLFGERR